MDVDYKIQQIYKNNGGLLILREASKQGISKYDFYSFVEENGLERIGRGVYSSADVWLDAMLLIHLRSEQAIFSHETALFLHDMTDRETFIYSVTVKTGYNPHRLKEDGIKVYTIKEELHELGLSEAITPFGHLVPVYDKERTLCDILRNRKNVDKQILQDALKSYSKRQDKDLRRLMGYAETFRVKSILKPYLEVLL
ncbi:MAG TPA: abortive phage infection protein [Clostridiaceae bacterium]|nr:abortive phage infection protein [Clostridiaceae bacterium]